MSTKLCGGKFKGRILDVPEGLLTRPTSNKIRQALFNTLGQNFSGVRFLDVFAGSGSVGFEALSRGATEVVFVEKNDLAIETIRKNARLLHVESRISIVNMDAESYLLKKREVKKTDVTFIDPPFYPEFLDLAHLVPELKGEFVVQYPTHHVGATWLKYAIKIKKYGVSSLAYFDL
jgi:16S rRNA (guanine966-N2)-methyltransferase